MNTVRIVKSDAKLYYRQTQANMYAETDHIVVYQSYWTAEEVAVLAGLDLHKLVKAYNDKYKWHGHPPTFTAYLRSHIQAKIQEGKDERA